MNSQQFLDILRTGKNLKKDDFTTLMKFHETFPYFQIPKVLLARYEFLKTEGDSREFLSWAAICSPDRRWLKELVESDSAYDALERTFDSEQILGNKKLQDDSDEVLVPDPDKDTDPKERAEILKRLGENLQKKEGTTSHTPQRETEAEPKPGKKPKRKNKGDDLIETIKKKAKKEILDEKKKEQIDIIRSFSKKEIKLATLKEIEDNHKQNDLSADSTRLNPSLVSESYAKLLEKQGKKKKAREIYQNLMVNFPNKSAYFADLIKALEE